MLVGIGAAAGIVGILGFAFTRQRKRSVALQAIAMRLNFRYLGSALPGSVELAGTEIAQLSSVWNVIDGERNGTLVVAFDCRIGTGKGSWQRTVIAARTAKDVFAGRSGHLEQQRSGDWVMIFEPCSVSLTSKGLMSASELSAYIEGI